MFWNDRGHVAYDDFNSQMYLESKTFKNFDFWK